MRILEQVSRHGIHQIGEIASKYTCYMQALTVVLRGFIDMASDGQCQRIHRTNIIYSACFKKTGTVEKSSITRALLKVWKG